MTFAFAQLVAAAWLGSLLTLLWLYWPRRPKAKSNDRLLATRISEGNFLKSEVGATAIEYGLVLVLVSLACFTVLEDVASGLNGIFTTLSDKFSTVR